VEDFNQTKKKGGGSVGSTKEELHITFFIFLEAMMMCG
jgi:hypothetical protein